MGYFGANQMSDEFTMEIPYDCPRGRDDCRSLSKIQSPNSFFCCGENNGKNRPVGQDNFTTCFKGEFRDDLIYSDKRDLLHQASVILRGLAVVEKDHYEPDGVDWSPWNDIISEQDWKDL